MFKVLKLIETTKLIELAELIWKSKRPVIIAGHGIELGKCILEFKTFLNLCPIPVVWSQGGINVLPTDHPLNIGKIGTKGSRAGNFAVQNSDLVISIGSRLSVSTTGQEYNLFTREANLVVVDIDDIEHMKKTVKIDLFIQMDAKQFLAYFSGLVNKSFSKQDWVEKCQHWKEIFPVYQPEFSASC